jgi:glycosyltransferase involved in cell wall biosynthesis
VIYGGLDRVSGGFLYDRMLVAGLRGLGVTVDVVALPWWGYGRALAANALPLPHGLPDYDLVLQDELCHPALFLRNRWLAARVPVVALVHNLGSQQPRARLRALAARVERRYLRGVAAVIAVCERTRRDVEALAGHAPRALVAYAGRDHVTPAMDGAAIAARAAAAGPLRVLTVAAVAPHKGLLRLLPALAGLGDRAVLDVAGSLTQDPGYVRAVRARVAALGLGARVRLHGELGREALAALYRASHVLALPSDREAYPLAGLEALGFGLPALLPVPGGAGELVTDGVEGHLLAPDDVAAWTAALTRLAGDRARLAAMGNGALARYHAHRTWSDTAAQVAAFCADVVRGPQAGAIPRRPRRARRLSA